MNKIVEKAKKPLLCAFLVLYVLYIILAVTYFTSNYWLQETNFELFSEMQGLNDMLLYVGIIGICCFAVMAIVGSISRRYYYLSNLIFNIAACVVAMVFALIVLIQQMDVLPKFEQALPELKDFTDLMQASSTSKITPSNIYIVLAIVLSTVCVVVCVLFIATTVIKYFETVSREKQRKAQMEVAKE